MVHVLLHFFVADLALEAVVAGVGVADAYLSLKVPVAAEDEVVAVADAEAAEPALVAAVLEFRGIRAEQVDAAVEAPDVVLPGVDVYAEEMAGETVAEPVARLRLHCPVLPASAVGERPAVELALRLKGPLGRQAHLRSEVDIQKCVGQQVRLESDLLCANALKHGDEQGE